MVDFYVKAFFFLHKSVLYNAFEFYETQKNFNTQGKTEASVL